MASAARRRTGLKEATKYSSKPTRVAFQDLTEESVRCRLGGHVWKPYDAKRLPGGFETEELCERCTSKRTTELTNRGEVQRRKIKYAEHYLSPAGRLEAADRDSMRLMTLHWDYKL